MTDATRLTCEPSPDGHCSICGDAAVLARVVAIDGATATAELRDGTPTTVAIDLVENVAIGETLVVHLGFAIGRLSEDGRG